MLVFFVHQCGNFKRAHPVQMGGTGVTAFGQRGLIGMVHVFLLYKLISFLPVNLKKRSKVMVVTSIRMVLKAAPRP